MRKLLLTTTTLFALSTVSHAAIIADLGINPTSANGHFSNDVFGTTFSDQYTFELAGASQFVTFASATNDYVSAADFITDFTGQLFSAGADGAVGGGDDFAVNPPVLAVGCPTNPGGCQILAGTAILGAGDYFLSLSGTGGGTAGYGGNLTTAAIGAIPEASTWAMLLLGFACCGWLTWRRRRELAC